MDETKAPVVDEETNDERKPGPYERLKDCPSEELIRQLAPKNSNAKEAAQYILFNKWVGEVTAQMKALAEKIAAASTEQKAAAGKIFWLNIILTVATLVMAIEAATKLWHP